MESLNFYCNHMFILLIAFAIGMTFGCWLCDISEDDYQNYND